LELERTVTDGVQDRRDHLQMRSRIVQLPQETESAHECAEGLVDGRGVGGDYRRAVHGFVELSLGVVLHFAGW
jgi:hypothetical protein